MAVTALWQIGWPIDHARQEAERMDGRLDGHYACLLANDANHLRDIAQKAYNAQISG